MTKSIVNGIGIGFFSCIRIVKDVLQSIGIGLVISVMGHFLKIGPDRNNL